MFTNKLYHCGKMISSLKQYVGGEFDYLDMGDVDTTRIIEIMTMLKEVNQLGGHTFYYKLPKIDMEKWLWNLDSDAD